MLGHLLNLYLRPSNIVHPTTIHFPEAMYGEFTTRRLINTTMIDSTIYTHSWCQAKKSWTQSTSSILSLTSETKRWNLGLTLHPPSLKKTRRKKMRFQWGLNKTFCYTSPPLTHRQSRHSKMKNNTIRPSVFPTIGS